MSNKKINLKKVLDSFVLQSHTDNLKTSLYPKSYDGLRVKISFGKGTKAEVPWVAFLGEGMEVRNGIYPVYLYYKKSNILILAYGISETKKSVEKWPSFVLKNKKTIESVLGSEVSRYGDSYIFKKYNIKTEGEEVIYLDGKGNELNFKEIRTDLDSILNEYKNIILKQEGLFSVTTGKLEELINSFDFWLETDGNSGYIEKSKEVAGEIKDTLLNKKFWKKSTDEEVYQEIDNYLNSLPGPAKINLGEKRIKENLEDIKENIFYFMEGGDIFQKAGEIIDGQRKIKYLAKSFWTPIFRAAYPERCPNWNEKTEEFISKLGLDIKDEAEDAGKRYELLSKAFRKLKEIDSRQDFYSLDYLMHYGVAVDEGKDMLAYLTIDLDFIIKNKTIQGIIENYTEIRAKGKFKDKEWSEAYKWDILPKLNEEFEEKITKDNILEKIKLLKKENPSSGSFTHWSALDNLEKAAKESPTKVAKRINKLWKGEKDLFKRINDFRSEIAEIKEDATIGTPLAGYLLAAYDVDKYPPYKDSAFLDLKRIIGKEKEWRSFSLGLKYQVFTEICRKIGEYLNEKNLIKKQVIDSDEIEPGKVALDGQDFIYLLQDLKDIQEKEDGNSEDKDNEKGKGITKEEIYEEIFMKNERFDKILNLLNTDRKKQLIIQGPPGTGKTFVAKRIAYYKTQDKERIETIQFHPSYSYEDFIEGYRPAEGKGFKMHDGVFKEFCKKATDDLENNYVFVIDEINRGNLSKIFGELMYLLEYRDKEVRLTYSNEKFSIPKNVYILGTMNTADRSLAIMDYALRRRFYFIDQPPQPEYLKDWLEDNGCDLNLDNLISKFREMNEEIEEEMNSDDFAVGHSYLMKENMNQKDLEEALEFQIKPLLKQYFIDRNQVVERILSIFD